MRILCLAFCFVLAVAASAQNLLIFDVNVVDPRTRTIKRAEIYVRQGVIDSIYYPDDEAAKTRAAETKSHRPPKTLNNKKGEQRMVAGRADTLWHWNEVRQRDRPEIIGGHGRWLIPGLHDMHVHSYGNAAPGNVVDMMGSARAAKVMLATGVTAFLDLFTPEDAILSLRDKQRSGASTDVRTMADIYAAGPILTCTGGHGTEYGLPTRIINSPSDARREIADLAKRKPDVIKIVYDHAYGALPTIDIATMEAAVKGAASLGIKTVIHIGTWQDAKEAILAGANCITHVHSEPIPVDVVRLMRDRKVVEIPTLCVQSELVNISDKPLVLDHPLLMKAASSQVLDAHRDTAKYDKRARAFRAYTAKALSVVKANVRAMFTGGVRILAGTDAGNMGVFQGYSLHRELELLVDAGVPAWDALAGATTAAGDFLGTNVGFRKGDVANFVMLERSPIDDIRNTTGVYAIVHHGVLMDQTEFLTPTAVVMRNPVLDEFLSNSAMSTSGHAWASDLDTLWGGKSSIDVAYNNGVMHAKGRAIPVGQRPALAGVSLPLSDESPIDVSAWKGVRVKVVSASGPIQLKLVTKGITNYDYHAVTIPQFNVPRTLEFPFAEFKQLWSAPVPWTGKDVGAVALWVSTFGVPADFEFTIDAIEFY